MLDLFLNPIGWLVLFLYSIPQLFLGLFIILKKHTKNFLSVLKLGFLLGLSTYINVFILDRPGLLNLPDRIASILPTAEILLLTFSFLIAYFFKKNL